VFFSTDCSGTLLTTFSGSDACHCKGQSVFGNEIGVSVSCTGAAPITCDAVTHSPTVTPPHSASPTLPAASGTPVWGAVYSTATCEDSSFIGNKTVNLDDGGCFGTTAGGRDVSMDFSCEELSAESSWTAGLYLSTDCSGFRVVTLTAADACSCGGMTVMGISLGAHVSCDGSAPNCSVSGGSPNSNGEGSNGALGGGGVIYPILIGVGVLLAVLFVRIVYMWKCGGKQSGHHVTLGDSKAQQDSLSEKDSLCQL